ncbi:hypothetical protein B0O99DRAFT_674279 [Bisporella sp. PMI_857]|nr:hypothetical protein B0O99DRAFT_674279 [Bisporella sp. PMI_857]
MALQLRSSTRDYPSLNYYTPPANLSLSLRRPAHCTCPHGTPLSECYCYRPSTSSSLVRYVTPPPAYNNPVISTSISNTISNTNSCFYRLCPYRRASLPCGYNNYSTEDDYFLDAQLDRFDRLDLADRDPCPCGCDSQTAAEVRAKEDYDARVLKAKAEYDLKVDRAWEIREAEKRSALREEMYRERRYRSRARYDSPDRRRTRIKLLH